MVVTAVIQYPGTVEDPYSGEQTESWDNPTEVTVEGCVLAPRQSNEPLVVGRSPVYVGYMLYAPFGTVVDARCRVVIEGKTYRVEGEPFQWQNPMTGTQAGVEIAIERVDG